MQKLACIIFLITIMVCWILFVDSTTFGEVQNGTRVIGSITSDTTWTESSSPYIFTGNVIVAEGVTLTIDHGVTVNFTEVQPLPKPTGYNSVIGQPWNITTYSLQIDGTLRALGASNDPITFSSTDPYETINFTQTSSSWNEQNGSGSIIQNAVFGSYNAIGKFIGGGNIQITNGSPKIDHNSFLGGTIETTGGSPIIANNTLSGNITVDGGSPTISNNKITLGTDNNGNILGNTGIILSGQNNALVYDNLISSEFFYHSISTDAITVSSGAPLIERNFISSSNSNADDQTVGITVYGNTNPVIENNTVTLNNIALNIYDSNGSPTPTIAYNNFEQNSQYNIYLGQQGVFGSTSGNINAANNWWGTTDVPTINQTIFDSKNNNNLGKVTFTPIMTSPNPQATPSPNSPITISKVTPPPSQNPTSLPNQSGNQTNTKSDINSTQVLLVTILGIIIALVIIMLMRRNMRKKM